MSVGGVAFAAYRGVGRLAGPLAAPYLARRAARGKEDPGRLREKLGFASANLAERPIWLHAVSVGESVAALALADRLRETGFTILMTTGTPAAAARVGRADGVIHQYAPLDAPQFVARFLGHWRPRAALFTESDIWPTTLHLLAHAGVPRAHVNARLSARSHRRWAGMRALSRPLFGLIPLALAQSEADAARFADLGAGQVAVTGNLKFDAPAPVADPAALMAMRGAIAERPVWLAASIHPGEEEAVVAAHMALAKRLAGLVTIVAPRHPATADLVARAAATAGLTDPPRRSAGALPAAGLYLADTLGEMGTLFHLAPVTFLGGSLIPLGGHNPAEPAACGTALLTGPSHGPMFEPFLNGGGATLAADGSALADHVAALLVDESARAAMTERASAILSAERGAVDRTLAALGPLLAKAQAAP